LGYTNRYHRIERVWGMTGDGRDQSKKRNVSPADDSVLDELDRLSNDGGVAPIIPHRQSSEQKGRSVTEKKQD
jgi:hypothetical protein